MRGPTARTGAVVVRWTAALEASPSLDRAVSAVGSSLTEVLGAPRSRRVLGGAWMGHALHPLLTDIPIGCWTSAMILDVIGGERARPAATSLVAIGTASAVPTALTGASDWTALTPEQQRVGVVHAAANGAATALYLASLVARRRGRHRSGVALGMAGGAVATVGGYLGGHLAAATDAALRATTDARSTL